MPFIYRLIAKAFAFIVDDTRVRQGELLPAEDETEIASKKPYHKAGNFDQDYTRAIRMLRDRLDRNFPDGQYAHRRLRMSTPHDHGEDRAQAVDTMSAVIAMALRNGATVEEAAELGAMSVGI